MNKIQHLRSRNEVVSAVTGDGVLFTVQTTDGERNSALFEDIIHWLDERTTDAS